MQIIPVKRRRSNDGEAARKRDVTVLYTLFDEEGEVKTICKAAFLNTFGITNRFIDTLTKKKKMGMASPVDQRGGPRNIVHDERSKEQICEHIRSLPREPSHYGRTDTDREYLASELNFTLLHNSFVEKYPETRVTRKFYITVFKNNFKQLRFRAPRVDTCRTCDRLHCALKAAITPIEVDSKKQDLEAHHMKAESARAIHNADVAFSKMPNNHDVVCISIDLQQIFSLPTLTHSDMYYLRQCSCYNFGVHIHNTSNAFMCMWDETQGSKGANDIASCLFYLLNKDPKFPTSRKLVIWSDNCSAQNKNKILIFLYAFLIQHNIVDQIEHKFLLSGHSYLSCDRDFALIGKKMKRKVCCDRDDLAKVIRSARNDPFIVRNIEQFFDFKNGAERLLNTTKLCLSSVVWMKISSEHAGRIFLKRSFADREFETHCFLKRGK